VRHRWSATAVQTLSHLSLLGQLAGEGWFMGMGEVAATKSLTWLASDPQRMPAADGRSVSRPSTDDPSDPA
jgi:hypothetical protein